MENKREKRYYKAGEMVWVVAEKVEGKVKSINREDLTVTVTIKKGQEIVEHVLKMWEIDKLKYKAKDKLVKAKKKTKSVITKGQFTLHDGVPTVYFAKVKPDAIIPSKREEDAGYDVYANIEGKEVDNKVIHEIFVPAFETTLVPTGIAMALPNTHYFNAKHERGSTGKYSISVLAGVVDSGYRGEVFIALTPLYKDVLITSEVTETEVGDNVILYPYSKAICQGTIDLVPEVHIKVIDFESLQKIESERGDTKLGHSGK